MAIFHRNSPDHGKLGSMATVAWVARQPGRCGAHCELLRPTSEMFGFNSSSSAYKPRTHCYHAMGTYGQHDCVFSVVLRFKIKETFSILLVLVVTFLGHKMCCDLGHISSDCDSLRNEVVEAFNEGRVWPREIWQLFQQHFLKAVSTFFWRLKIAHP